jgi:RimJ/RimL family protein N-acetyltransferase
MNIRHIRLEDAEQFANLLVSVDSSNMMLFEPGERKTSRDQEEQRIESILFQANSTIIVAEEADRLIGYLLVLGGQKIRKRHSGHIVTGVLEEFRGKGIGALLFNESLQWAKEAGVTRFELTVIKSNERAVKFYENLGFKVEGEKVDSLMLNGQLVNEVCLYKLL